jgi:CelD/BcsL family acetyltransferase involved in cellulose biosynthesis
MKDAPPARALAEPGLSPAPVAGQPAPGPLRLEVARDRASWDALAPAWDQAALRADAFYLGHVWLSSWWEAFGGGALSLMCVRLHDRLVALAPWRRMRGRWCGLPVTRVESLFNSHACFSDVALVEREREALSLVFGGLDEEPWHMVVIRQVPPGSRLLAQLPELRRERGLAAHARPRLQTLHIPIRGSWEDYLSTRSARFRKNLRNKENRLRASGLASRLECHSSPADVEAVMPEVMDVALRSWTARRGSSIAQPPQRRFYEICLPRLARQGHLRIWALRLGGRMAAFEIHVAWARRVACPKAAYDQQFTPLSPGALLDARVVEALFRGGEFERYDLMGEADAYKQRWTDSAERHVDLFVFNRRPLSRLAERVEFGLRPGAAAVVRRLTRARPDPA